MGDALGWSTQLRGCAVAALLVGLLASCSDDDPKPGKGAFGTRCDEDTDCKSLICAGLDGETKLCTESCSDPLGDECDEGFRCRRPERTEGLVCVCTNPLGCEADDPHSCVFASECDDNVECTEDRCELNECAHFIRPSFCATGSSCDVDEGCVDNPVCTTNFDCETSSDPCRSSSFCDGATGRCQYDVTDDDFDGQVPEACGGDDCNDFDSSIFRGASERCDSVDNDCDGSFDEGADQFCSGRCSFGQCTCDGSFNDCSSFGGSECTDLRSDPFNCGQCGFVCGDGSFCQNGVCAGSLQCADGVICPPNSTCGDVPSGVECRCNFGFEPNASATECIDINECDRGLDDCDGSSSVCVNLFGGFDCLCGNGLQNVGGTCQDINECLSGFDCGQGFCSNEFGGFRCVCNPGFEPHPTEEFCVLIDECEAGLIDDFRWCDGSCRDLLNDSSHCGDCNVACQGSAFCDGGQCTCNDETLTYCDGACVNERTNPQHCGECYAACPSGASCVNGDCVCPMGQAACDGTCVALGTVDRCQACDDVCAQGASCTGSGCACPGSTPLVCGGQCVNPNDDELHCGGCFEGCPVDATCNGGHCNCPAEAPDLCENSTSCNDFDTSERACGNCETSCAVICNEGECGTAARVALGADMGCVLFDDGRVGCFGSNDSGRLGRGLSTSLVSQQIGVLALSDITALAVHDAHACALDKMGVLRCWGENSAQQLGNGNTMDQATPVTTRTGVAQVAVGLLHTCVVLKETGKVECVGSDAFGQRGDGAPSPAFGTWTGPSDLENVSMLVSGANHLCALVEGEVFCWGDNSSGQLGVGRADGGLNAPGEKVTGLSGVTDLAAGRNHTCAVAGGQLLCWGENSNMQCGSSDTTDRLFATLVGAGLVGVRVTAGGAHSCALLENGGVSCWGSGSDGQNLRAVDSAVPRTLVGPATDIAAGKAHSCAIAHGDFYCWGDGPSITFGSDAPSPVRIER